MLSGAQQFIESDIWSNYDGQWIPTCSSCHRWRRMSCRPSCKPPRYLELIDIRSTAAVTKNLIFLCLADNEKIQKSFFSYGQKIHVFLLISIRSDTLATKPMNAQDTIPFTKARSMDSHLRVEIMLRNENRKDRRVQSAAKRETLSPGMKTTSLSILSVFLKEKG